MTDLTQLPLDMPMFNSNSTSHSETRSDDIPYDAVDHIIDDYHNAMSVTKIAAQTQRTVTQIKAVLIDHYGENFKEERNRQVAEELNAQLASGLSAAQLATRMGVTERTIYRKTTGRRPVREKLDDATRAWLEQLIDDQTPQLEISDTIGISVERVARISAGRGWNRSQAAQFTTWLRQNPKARQLLNWSRT